MRFSIVGDDDGKTLVTSGVRGNADGPAASHSGNTSELEVPDDFEDPENPKTAERLFIGPPPRSPQAHVLQWAGFIVLAATVLATWLLPSSSNDETGPLALIAAAAAPQRAMPTSGQASAGTYASPADPLMAYAQFCQNNPIQCVSPMPTALADLGYARFCENSLTLCTRAKPN
jgi:hypothetical protein